MTRWFQIDTSNGVVTVHLLASEGSAWKPEVLASSPLPPAFTDRVVRVGGKAPLWMYAHVAMMARRDGAQRIEVVQPQQLQPVSIFPFPERVGPEPNWLCYKRDPAGGGIVEFQRPPQGELWNPNCLGSLQNAGSSWDPDMITLTGPGPNWLYAAVACLAVEKPSRIISYFSPREALAIRLNAATREEIEIPPSPELVSALGSEGKVIGVVGDPNSGKSVFSILLEKGFHIAGFNSLWRLDCDHAAPTPHWYLQMMAQNRGTEAADLREAQKREWTPEAERAYNAQLRHCARSLAWVIADFPGGIHKRQPVQRIPAGREVLLRAADCFVILARRDKPESVIGWRESLSEHGLAEKVVAVVESTDHLAPLDLRLTGNDPIRAEVDGLDRTSLSNSKLSAKLTPWATLARSIISGIEARHDA